MDLCEGRDGQWRAVFLGVRPQVASSGDRLESQLGRETFLCPVTWNAKGWPVINEGNKVTTRGNAATNLKRLSNMYLEQYQSRPNQGQ